MCKGTRSLGGLERTDGVTLVELLIVVAIVAVLASIGVPSYVSAVANYRILTEVNGLVGDLQYARSEAVKQGMTVQMCISTDGQTCSTSAVSWAAGHVVVASPPGSDCTRVGGGCTLLRAQPAFSGTDSGLPTPSTQTSIAFGRDGFAGTSSGTWNGFSPLAQSVVLTVRAVPDISGLGNCVLINTVGQISVLARGTAPCT